MLTGIDISNGPGGIEPATVRCGKAAGVKKLICGTQNETMTRRQVGVAQSEGLPVELYVYLYFDRDPVAKVKAAADRAQPPRRLPGPRCLVLTLCRRTRWRSGWSLPVPSPISISRPPPGSASRAALW